MAGETPYSDLYRQTPDSSPAVILIADADDPPEVLSGLKGRFESLGCRVFLESWSNGAEKVPAGRRGRGGPTAEQQLMARIDSLAGVHGEATWALGGSGRGTSIAISAAVRSGRPPACLFLLSPVWREEEPPPDSYLAGLDVPLLIIATRSAPGAAEAHLDLYIGTRPHSSLWTLSSGGRGADLLVSRAHLMVDLCDWVCGNLSVESRRPSDQGGDAPVGSTTEPK